MEIFVNLIHPLPFFDKTFDISHPGNTEVCGSTTYKISLSTYLIPIMFVKIYLIFRLFAQYTSWMNQNSIQCCQDEGCEANTLFAMKASLKDKPYQTLIGITMTSVIILGLTMRIFEYP